MIVLRRTAALRGGQCGAWARGAMARHIIERCAKTPDDLRDFNSGGYAFDTDVSDGDKMVFLRDYPVN